MRNLIQNLRSGLNRWREILFKGLFRARYRYDVFISYSHSDAKGYAVNLKKQLGSLDFACFIDEEESPPGLSLGPTLEKALRKSAVLVLLATERALTRPYIALEFESFVPTKRRIIPINISGALTSNGEQALQKAPWNLINQRKLIWIDETTEAFAKQNPSPPIADGIDKLFKYTRRNVRVRTEIIGTAALVLLASFGAGFVIKSQAAEVTRQAALAEVFRKGKEEQQQLEAEAREETKRQQGIADERKREALTQSKLAADAKKEAERQLMLARTASAEANKSQVVARTAKLEAEKQLGFNHSLRYVTSLGLVQKELDAFNRVRNQSIAGYGPDRGREMLRDFLPDSDPSSADDVRGFEWYRLWHLFSDDESMLTSQDAPVNSVAFSPDGALLAMGSEDGILKLWNMSKRQEMAATTGNPIAVNCVTFSPDGKVLALGRRDGTLSLRDSTGKEMKSLNRQAVVSINSVAFSANGKMLAALDGNKTMRFWETNTWKESSPLADLTARVNSFAFSPDNKVLATGTENNTVDFWDTTTWKKIKTLSGHTQPVKSIAFSADSKMLATGSSDNTLRLWDISTEKEKWTHKMSDVAGTVTALAFSPDGFYLAVGYHKWIYLFDTNTEQSLRTTYVGSANSVAFSPDAKTLAAGGGAVATRSPYTRSGDGSSPGNVVLMDLNPEKYEVGLADAEAPLVFSPNGSLLATGGHHAVKVINTDTWQEAASLAPGFIGALAFSPNNKMLATAVGRLDEYGHLIWSDWDISLWDTSRWVSLMMRKAHSSLIHSIAFSPDSRVLATASDDGTVMLWNTANPTMEPVTIPGSIPIAAVAFFPEGTLMIADLNGGVRLWDTNRGREIAKKHVAGGKLMAVSPDGKRLAVAEWNAVSVWDTHSWRQVETPSLMFAESLTCIAFSQDGKTLATGNDVSENVTLWQTETGQELMKLPAPFVSSHSVAFSSNGKMLAVATKGYPSKTTSLMLWFAATREEVTAQMRK